MDSKFDPTGSLWPVGLPSTIPGQLVVGPKKTVNASLGSVISSLTEKKDQRTNDPVNANLITRPNISTKTSFAKFDIVLKWVTVNSGSSFL